MVVMVQWEIAERLMATPSSKEYASLAVLTQSIADVTLVRKVLPSVFWPRPAVDSAIVMIRPNAAKRAVVGDVQRFRNFLRDLYVHRRKCLRAALPECPRGAFPSQRSMHVWRSWKSTAPPTRIARSGTTSASVSDL